jgi:hypothetical protein
VGGDRVVLTSSAVYKDAIHAPNMQGAFRVDLYAGASGPVLAYDVPVFGGSVTANLTHRVTRTGTFTVGEEWWPGNDASAPLTPYQTVAVVKAGIRYGDGSEELFPVIKGRVGDLTRDAGGRVTARIDDLAADVVAWRFEAPRVSENVSVLTQIQRLISEVLPGTVLGASDVTDAQTPPLVWDEDRGKALDDLAESLGGRWYTLGDGTFVVRRYQYDVGTPVQTFADGPRGLLLSGAPSLTRDGAANSVTVVVERFDGSTPFRVTARDTSPSSPTRWGGPFGNVTKIIKVQTPLTVGEATIYARTQLNASTALSSQWSASVVPDYTMEPGDTVWLDSRNVRALQLIDQITYPLGPAAMSLGTRAYVRAQATLD